jgi:hypothetical protein
MRQSLTTSKSPLQALKRIRRLVPAIRDHVRQIDAEMERTHPHDAGEGTPLMIRRTALWNRLRRLWNLEIKALQQVAASRLKSAPAPKITHEKYRAASETSRSRKELALLLGVSKEGLVKWERVNHIRLARK